jgi:hypothetical protein
VIADENDQRAGPAFDVSQAIAAAIGGRKKKIPGFPTEIARRSHACHMSLPNKINGRAAHPLPILLRLCCTAQWGEAGFSLTAADSPCHNYAVSRKGGLGK